MQTTKLSNSLNDPLIKLPKVIEITGVSRSSIYAGIKNQSFPAPLKTGKRAVAWKSSQIQSWIDSLQTNHICNGGQL